MKQFLCSYNHGGSEWSFSIKADSFEDAYSRLERIRFAKLDGEFVEEIPACTGIGFLVRAYCWCRNVILTRRQ